MHQFLARQGIFSPNAFFKRSGWCRDSPLIHALITKRQLPWGNVLKLSPYGNHAVCTNLERVPRRKEESEYCNILVCLYYASQLACGPTVDKSNPFMKRRFTFNKAQASLPHKKALHKNFLKFYHKNIFLVSGAH